MNNNTTSYIQSQLFIPNRALNTTPIISLTPISHWRNCFCFFGALQPKPKQQKYIHKPFIIKGKEPRIGTLGIPYLRGDLNYIYEQYLNSGLTIATNIGFIATEQNPYVIAIGDGSNKELTSEVADSLGMCFYDENPHTGIQIAIGKTKLSNKLWRMQVNRKDFGFKLYLNHAVRLTTNKPHFFEDRKMDTDSLIRLTQRHYDWRLEKRKSPNYYIMPDKSYIDFAEPYRVDNWDWGIKNRSKTYMFMRNNIRPTPKQVEGVMVQAFDRALHVAELAHDDNKIAGMLWNIGLTLRKEHGLIRFSDEKIAKMIKRVMLGYIDFRTSTDFLEQLITNGIIEIKDSFHPIGYTTKYINMVLNDFRKIDRFGHLYLSNDKVLYSTQAIKLGLEELSHIGVVVSNDGRYSLSNIYFNAAKITEFFNKISDYESLQF